MDKKLPNPKQDELDPAASAFEALRDEVAELRQSINQLSQNIQLIPTQADDSADDEEAALARAIAEERIAEEQQEAQA